MALSLPRLPDLPELGAEWYDQNPAAALEYRLSQSGTQTQPFLEYLRRQLPIFRDQWLALLPFNPDLHFVDFLSPELFARSFAAASPFERGERPQLFAPSLRYLPF